MKPGEMRVKQGCDFQEINPVLCLLLAKFHSFNTQNFLVQRTVSSDPLYWSPLSRPELLLMKPWLWAVVVNILYLLKMIYRVLNVAFRTLEETSQSQASICEDIRQSEIVYRIPVIHYIWILVTVTPAYLTLCSSLYYLA